MNESNTRVLLIEPVLDALGWDTQDVNVVTREYRVFDGKYLDYALSLSGRPSLFIEAKALGTNLDDPKVVAQTVNYANNEGVIWCVLSDGQRYRVFKANEPVAMNKKLVFEIDLAETTDSRLSDQIISRLLLLSESSLREKDLHDYHIDQQVNLAWAKIFADPTSGILDPIREALPTSQHNLSDGQIWASTKRLLTAQSLGTTIATDETPTAHNSLDSPTTDSHHQPRYTFEHQFDNKSSRVLDLYRQLHGNIQVLDQRISREFKKWYTNYRIGKRIFLSVEPQKQRMKLFLHLNPAKYQHSFVRDVTNIGHAGTGDMEVRFESPDQLDQILEWIRDAVTTVDNR